MEIDGSYLCATAAGKVCTQKKQHPAHDICEGQLYVSAWNLTQNPKKVEHFASNHLY
jgi:hypothetical protein